MFTNDPNYKPKNGEKRAKNRNKLTTDAQIADMSLTLWESEDYIRRAMLKTNLNSYFRDRIVRLLTRMEHEARKLGEDLNNPDTSAFESFGAAKESAKQFGVS
jgi:hypothetical protein